MVDFQDYLNQKPQDPDCPKGHETFTSEYEANRGIILSWDPDFIKTIPSEALAIDHSAMEMATGDFLTDSDINWN